MSTIPLTPPPQKLTSEHCKDWPTLPAARPLLLHQYGGAARHPRPADPAAHGGFQRLGILRVALHRKLAKRRRIRANFQPVPRPARSTGFFWPFGRAGPFPLNVICSICLAHSFSFGLLFGGAKSEHLLVTLKFPLLFFAIKSLIALETEFMWRSLPSPLGRKSFLLGSHYVLE